MISRRLRQAWRGMGGEEFFKPIYYLPALTPLLIAGVRLSDAREQNWVVVTGYFWANALGIGLLVVLAYFLVRYKKSRGLSFGPWLVVGIAVAIGVTKAFTTAQILVWLELEADVFESTWIRLLGAITASLVTIIFVSIFGAMRLIYSAEREKLLLARVSREQPRVTREVFAELRDLVQTLRQSANQSLAPEQSRSLISSLLQEKIRPMSHELWARESKRLRSFDLKELLKQTLFHDPYPALLIALVIPVVTPIWPALFGGRWFEVFEESLQMLVVWFGLAMLNLAKERLSERQLVPITIAVLLSVSFMAGYLIPVASGVETPITAILSAVFLTLFLPNVAIVFGFGRSFLSASREQQQGLQDELDSLGRSNTEQLQEILIGRELAAALHGKVQNRFLLSMARLSSGETTMDHELDDIEELVHQLQKSLFETEMVSTESIERGFAAFLDLKLSSSSKEISRLQAKVIEEAVSNAYRHGKASGVQVNIDPDGKRIEVLDNGLGPTLGNKGLGSFIFDSIGTWSLTASEEGGSKLLIEIAS